MKFKLLFILSFTISTIVYAQPHNERIKALKIAYITEQLELSESEAQKFWPIYNTFESENETLRKNAVENRKNLNIDMLTDAEADALLKTIEAQILKRQKLHSAFISKLQAVLSSKKILKLKKTERDFKRRMLREFKNRRGLRDKN